MAVIIILFIVSFSDFLFAYLHALTGDLPLVVLNITGGFYLALAATMELFHDYI